MSLQHSVTYKNWRLTYMITASDSIEIVKGEPAGGLFSFSPKSLETLEIPQTIKGYQVIGIGEEAFRLTPEKTPSVVVLPDTIEYIRKRAFISCRNLRLIKLPQGLKEIGSHAFRDCINLQAAECFSADDYSVPVTRLKIGEGAFLGCRQLTAFDAHSVAAIGSNGFRKCEALEDIFLSEGVIDIAENAFDDCPSVVIRCPAGSYASQYAARHHIKCRYEGSQKQNDPAPASEKDNTMPVPIYSNNPYPQQTESKKDIPLQDEGQQIVRIPSDKTKRIKTVKTLYPLCEKELLLLRTMTKK